MKISAYTRSRVIGAVEQITGLGLRVGAAAAIAAAAYLLYTAFGSSMREVAKMSAADREQFTQGIQLLMTILTAGSAVVVGSLVIRLFGEEALGQVLSLLGAILYFGTPALFGLAVSGGQVAGNELFASVVNEFRVVGAIALLPGLVLVLRDAILRIWTGASVRRVIERRWGDEEERRKKHRKPRFYGSCWDMPFCREFVRRMCPAWEAKKPCWRMKVGCYCDERTILAAMTSYGTDNEHVRGIMHSLGLDQPRDSLLNARQKRARCRRCGIYTEHQRQKYRLVSPLVFPAVGLVLYAFYGQISSWLWVALERTDTFLRVLTLQTEASVNYSFADQGEALTTLAMVWVAIIAVSYALRVVEYLIFEMQV